MVSCPRTPNPSPPWASAIPALIIWRMPFSFPGLLFRTLITLYPKPCFFYYQRMTQPLISHMSVNFLIKVLFLQCLYLAFPSQLFQRKRHLSCFPADTHICASSHPVLCGVEQTATGSDLKLSPSSNILQLFPASLLPEYGNYIITVSNCKFHSLLL